MLAPQNGGGKYMESEWLVLLHSGHQSLQINSFMRQRVRCFSRCLLQRQKPDARANCEAIRLTGWPN